MSQTEEVIAEVAIAAIVAEEAIASEAIAAVEAEQASLEPEPEMLVEEIEAEPESQGESAAPQKKSNWIEDLLALR